MNFEKKYQDEFAPTKKQFPMGSKVFANGKIYEVVDYEISSLGHGVVGVDRDGNEQALYTFEALKDLPRGTVIRIDHMGKGLARVNGYNKHVNGIEYTAIGGGGAICKAEQITDIVADNCKNCPEWEEAERAHFGKSYTNERPKLFTGTCPGCNSHFASEKKILPGIICPACQAERYIAQEERWGRMNQEAADNYRKLCERKEREKRNEREQERLEAAERCHYQNLNDRGIL